MDGCNESHVCKYCDNCRYFREIWINEEGVISPKIVCQCCYKSFRTKEQERIKEHILETATKKHLI